MSRSLGTQPVGLILALTVAQSSEKAEEYIDEIILLLMADISVAIADFFAGLILVYRCWIFWARNTYVVAAPIPICAYALGLVRRYTALHWKSRGLHMFSSCQDHRSSRLGCE